MWELFFIVLGGILFYHLARWLHKKKATDKDVTMKLRDGEMLDMANVEHVEVSIRNDGEVIWVNVDGRCVLRISKINEPVVIDDQRRKT